MLKPYDPIRLHLATWISNQLRFGLGLSEVPSVLDLFREFVAPPNPDLGDWALGCFRLAKPLNKKPAEIASWLHHQISKDYELSEWVEEAKPAGPYLNLVIHQRALEKFLLSPILTGQFFSQSLFEGEPKTMVEFSQPNTHKELHVGHLRNACLGDALIRIKRWVGTSVISATFPGDMGTHVAKTLWYLQTQRLIAPENHRGEWLGKMYTKSTLFLESLSEEKKLVAQKEIAQILMQLESGDGAIFELWKTTRQWSIELMQQMYEWLGIQFDLWYWESEVDKASRSYVKELFQQGKLILSQGAVGMDLSEDKLGFVMLLKSDGTGLYATKDLELARRKFQEQQIQRSVYVVDVRQELHFKQIFKVLEKLGFEQAKECHHLAYNFVELPDGAMSSRKGNIVPVRDLKDQMIAYIKEQYLQKYLGADFMDQRWTEQEVDVVANQVALGAIKFGMLKMDPAKKIVFDMKEWLKLEGDTGPFIQYSAARIQSLLLKAPKEALMELQDFEKQISSQGAGVKFEGPERALLQQLLYFLPTVEQAHRLEKPSVLCTYLIELAKKFNFFYHECSILSSEVRPHRAKRLALSRACLKVIQQGFELLGIPIPKRM
jgi:arginyl-tRNA synthetase